jgi:hypothetical protein
VLNDKDDLNLHHLIEVPTNKIFKCIIMKNPFFPTLKLLNDVDRPVDGVIQFACFFGVVYVDIWDLSLTVRVIIRDCRSVYWLDGVKEVFFSLIRLVLTMDEFTCGCIVGRWIIFVEISDVWHCFPIINGDIDVDRRTFDRVCAANRFIKELVVVIVFVDDVALLTKSETRGGDCNRGSSSLDSDAKLADGDARSIIRLLFEA